MASGWTPANSTEMWRSDPCSEQEHIWYRSGQSFKVCSAVVGANTTSVARKAQDNWHISSEMFLHYPERQLCASTAHACCLSYRAQQMRCPVYADSNGLRVSSAQGLTLSLPRLTLSWLHWKHPIWQDMFHSSWSVNADTFPVSSLSDAVAAAARLYEVRRCAEAPAPFPAPSLSLRVIREATSGAASFGLSV